MLLRYQTGIRCWRLLLSITAVWLIASVGRVEAESALAAQGAATGEAYQGMPVGFSEAGDPFRGNPNAPLTLVEYSDYLCPFCERYFRQTLPALLDKYGRTGRVKFVLRDFPLASLHPTASRGAMAARCAGEQSAIHLWRMYEELFQAQREWSRLADPTSFLASLAKKAGADLAAYEACVHSGRQEAFVQQSVAAAQGLGFAGTPTFQFVLGSNQKTYTLVGAHPVDVFIRWIDDLLAGKEPPKNEQTEQAREREIPFWLKREGLAPDPKRPGFTVAGDPYKGNPSAPLVMVEFGDFQCPACQRHTLTTQPELDKTFVETGQILWVVKHFPLRAHPYAPVAATAAECGGEQGRFWAIHHVLFEQVEKWSTSDDVDRALIGIATELGLDSARFTTCLNSRKALERVLRNFNDGQGIGITNVPGFILVRNGTPTMLVGTRSTEQFAILLRDQLARAKSGSTSGSDGNSVRGR